MLEPVIVIDPLLKKNPLSFGTYGEHLTAFASAIFDGAIAPFSRPPLWLVSAQVLFLLREPAFAHQIPASPRVLSI